MAIEKVKRGDKEDREELRLRRNMKKGIFLRWNIQNEGVGELITGGYCDRKGEEK